MLGLSLIYVLRLITFWQVVHDSPVICSLLCSSTNIGTRKCVQLKEFGDGNQWETCVGKKYLHKKSNGL